MNRNKKLILVSALAVLSLIPILTFAQMFDVGTVAEPPVQASVSDFVKIEINNIFNIVIWPLAVTVTIIFFIMAGLAFITASGDTAKLETARRYLIWAVAGVMVIILAFSVVATVRWLTGL